jgi:hypothetical protein
MNGTPSRLCCCLMLVVTLNACSRQGRGYGTSSPLPPAPGSTSVQADAPTVAAAFGGRLVLRHPARWQYVPVKRVEAGPFGQIGFLSTVATRQQCTSTQSTSGCLNPVEPLARGDVFIAVNAQFTGHASIARNTMVAGLPAQISQDHRPGESCPAGAGYELNVTINEPRDGSIFIVGCTADSDPATKAELTRMLTTATYR